MVPISDGSFQQLRSEHCLNRSEAPQSPSLAIRPHCDYLASGTGRLIHGNDDLFQSIIAWTGVSYRNLEYASALGIED